MDTTTYLALRDEVVSALHKRQLLDALQALQGQLSWVGTWQEQQEYAQIKDAYAALLRYFQENATDPTREERFLELLQRTYHLSLGVHHHFSMKYTTKYRAKLWQKLAAHRSQQSLAHTLRYEMDESVLFERVFCAEPWTKEEEVAAEELMRHPNRTESAQLTLVSAVTLSLLSQCDPIALRWLLRQTEKATSPMLRARLCVGLIYVMLQQRESISLFPVLEQDLRAWTHQSEWHEELTIAQGLLFASAHKNDTVEKGLKMFDDFVRQHKGKDAEFLPDFRQDMAKFMATRLIEGLAGMDISYDSFRKMFQRFPHFEEAANWFVPFSAQRLPGVKFFSQENFEQSDLGHRSMCDTDQYVMVEMLRKHATQSTDDREDNDEDEEISLEELDSDFFEAPNPDVHVVEISAEEAMLHLDTAEAKEKIEEVRRQWEGDRFVHNSVRAYYVRYIHDTYRFFHLFRHRNEYENPFRQNLMLREHPLFDGVFDEESTIATLAQLCFTIRDYRRALSLFQLLPLHRDVRVRLAQCLHALGNYEEAAAHLEELVAHEDDETLLRLLIECYDACDRKADALPPFMRLEQMFPEDMEIAYDLTQRFFEVELYADALDQIHKLLYLDESHFWAKRMKARCLFMQGNLSEALHIFSTLTEEAHYEPIVLKEYGCCAALSGQNDVALECFTTYLAYEADETSEQPKSQLELELMEKGELSKYFQERGKMLIDELRNIEETITSDSQKSLRPVRFVPKDFFDDALRELSHLGFTPDLAALLRDALNLQLER